MKKILLGILKWYLLVAGALATILVLSVVIGFLMEETASSKVNAAKPKDVQHVLNWASLTGCKIKEVSHNYQSVPHFPTGDHLTAYAIKVDGLAGMDLPASNNQFRKWYRGDQLPPNLQEALKLIDGCHHEIPCFPNHAELASEKCYFFPRRLEFHSE
ncbi:MAG: hypothetical protein LBD30_01370, partial [Verrucomicrobiales bacterium]|nr:hypothetical protein [Verrucomicrobiales bacterium]